ncbi:YggS family pyridoxal phosphate-dependent enzyme [Amycolatopsis antarctica]|uniref:YggS family pyridoxal phosphate-dependent enzyme n=1 Tax=Amycolatopsis antarctica TaxID=1854586 RepID=UPI001F0AAE42|nr:YggS family pyridoxal phosphate-dependent enzyme [Amycolatopsis antarctica]
MNARVDPAAPDARREDLRAALSDVRGRLERACAAAGRAAGEVDLLAVTKTFPALDAALLADLGLTAFAENRDQEASAKVPEVGALRPDAAIRWHMVGSVQRNKARSVARWADEVQSVDSVRLATALAGASGRALASGERDEPLAVLLQVSLDGDTARGGCPIGELARLADTVAESGELSLRGLMAVAPLGAEPGPAFERLALASAELRRSHPAATEISAGMSGDLEAAVLHGATRVRVGTALLGGRGLASP